MPVTNPWPYDRQLKLLAEIRQHLTQLAPHQRSRRSARLLSSAAEELERTLAEDSEVRLGGQVKSVET